MNDASKEIGSYCVFEYLYRDAGNWKTYGLLLLSGKATEEASVVIAQSLDCSNTFVAEQVGIPSLCAQHFKDCGSDGPGDLDHAYHEFIAVRAATREEVGTLDVFGALDDILRKFKLVDGRWNVRLSPNVGW
jgi:hypothetical protein